MKCLEIGDIRNPENKNYSIRKDNQRIIVIQNAKDGFVTIGYGHAIQSNEDAAKYGFNVICSIPKFADFDFSEKHSVEVINQAIKAQKDYYESINQLNMSEDLDC